MFANLLCYHHHHHHHRHHHNLHQDCKMTVCRILLCYLGIIIIIITSEPTHTSACWELISSCSLLISFY